MKNGFTLIELLAVIVIIAIVALIAYPIIDDVFDGSEKGSFKSSVKELVNLAETDYTEYISERIGVTGEITYNYTDGGSFKCNVTNCNELKYSGKIKGGHGTIKVLNGKATSVNIEDDLYSASLSGNEIVVTEK